MQIWSPWHRTAPVWRLCSRKSWSPCQRRSPGHLSYPNTCVPARNHPHRLSSSGRARIKSQRKIKNRECRKWLSFCQVPNWLFRRQPRLIKKHLLQDLRRSKPTNLPPGRNRVSPIKRLIRKIHHLLVLIIRAQKMPVETVCSQARKNRIRTKKK